MFKKIIEKIKILFNTPKLLRYRYLIFSVLIVVITGSALATYYYNYDTKNEQLEKNTSSTAVKITEKSDSSKNNKEKEDFQSDITTIQNSSTTDRTNNNSNYSNITSDSQEDNSEYENTEDSNEESNTDTQPTISPTLTTTSSSTSDPESPSAIVAFYADNQSDTDSDDANHQKVVDYILSTSATTVLHAGDIMEDGTQNSMDRFSSITSTLRSTLGFYSALGNNDRVVGDSSTPSQIYLDFFDYPNNEKWYSVNIGNLHAVFLDSAFSSGSSEQQSWLESDLQSDASQNRVTVVIYHHPTFKSSVHDKLVDYNVDFVVAGHVHAYSHTITDGIDYFTCTGQPNIGYFLAEVYEEYVDLYAYDSNNNLIDSFEINNR